jgi:dTMP kinase
VSPFDPDESSRPPATGADRPFSGRIRCLATVNEFGAGRSPVGAAGAHTVGGAAIASESQPIGPDQQARQAQPDQPDEIELGLVGLPDATATPQAPTPPSGTKPPADEEEGGTGVSAIRGLLGVRAFRRLWLVLGLSSLGDWLGLLATSNLAQQQVTGSAAKGVAFGSVIAVRMLPALVLGPLSGVIADRWNRRYTMVVCDLIRFLFFASIPGITLITDDPKIVIGWASVATFVIESVQMAWAPAKEAAVPNLLPKARLEIANQVTLATTYGITPVVAGLVLASATTIINKLYPFSNESPVNPTHLALYFNALTFLATALVVFFGIKEISGRAVTRPERKPSMLRELITGFKYVTRTPLVRGLVLGIFGAFGCAGVVIGTATFYTRSLAAGDSAFYLLFAILFVGLGVGIVAGPRIVGALSRRRWFGMSIVLAAVSVVILAVAFHLSIAVVAGIGVGVGAGMAFLSGTTLLYSEVTDDVRGRVFAFIQTGTQISLLLSISLSSVLSGFGGSHQLGGLSFSTSRFLLLVAGVLGILAGVGAFRQMDDKPGVAVLADLWGSMRGRPLGVPEGSLHLGGRFVVFEGGEGAGKSTQVTRLAERLRRQGRDVVLTREPGATEVGARIRQLVLGGQPGALAPRAEALLYAADRAHHVATVIRPALDRGAVVISDRYVDSSLAYQGAGRTLPVDQVAWLSRWATGGLKPDLVVLLDVDPTIGLSRLDDRGGTPDRLEAEALPFHERVRYAFLDLAAADPARYLVVDAAGSREAVDAAVDARVDKLLGPLPAPDAHREAAPFPAAPAADEQPAEPEAGIERDATAQRAGAVGPGVDTEDVHTAAIPTAAIPTAAIPTAAMGPEDVNSAGVDSRV